jgi:hypothetical protein
VGFWRSILGSLWSGPQVAAASPTPDVLRDEQALQALIERSGFSVAADQIRRLALPCLDIHYAGPGHEAPVGTSRLGGSPDLPGDTAWPTTTSGALLSFYGQIDLAEPEVTALETGLPQSGLLSLFVGAFEAALTPAPVAVVLSPAGSELERRPARALPEAFHDEATAELNPVIVRFERRLSFAALNRDTLLALQTLCPEGDMGTLSDGLAASPDIHTTALGQWLGHAPAIDELPESIYFHNIGRPGQERLRHWTTWQDWEHAKTISHRLQNGTIFRPWREHDDDNVRWQLTHKAEIDAGIAGYRSLLTIESNKPMGLWINDADPVYTFIQACALARGDISRIQAIATQH